MMTDGEWRTSRYVPTAEEYMKNAVVSFAPGPIVLPALYFVGPKISESIVRDPEYNELFRLMSACGHLLNDVQSYEAFVNLVLTLCDARDSVVMFAPYYFNAYMSFQMTGVTDILVGASNPKTLHPDVDWLEKALKENNPIPKLVTVVNPGNPSGAFIPKPMLQRISDLCINAGAWLVVGNTYESRTPRRAPFCGTAVASSPSSWTPSAGTILP